MKAPKSSKPMQLLQFSMKVFICSKQNTPRRLKTGTYEEDMHYPWIANMSWIFPTTRRVWHPKRIQTLVCIFTVIYYLIIQLMFIHILYRYFEGLSKPANALLRNQFSGRWIAWLQATDEVKYGEEIIYDYGFDPAAEASESESSSEDFPFSLLPSSPILSPPQSAIIPRQQSL